MSRVFSKTAARSTIVDVRTKVSLPDLDWDFAALEPRISGRINELNYNKLHQTYQWLQHCN